MLEGSRLLIYKYFYNVRVLRITACLYGEMSSAKLAMNKRATTIRGGNADTKLGKICSSTHRRQNCYFQQVSVALDRVVHS